MQIFAELHKTRIDSTLGSRSVPNFEVKNTINVMSPSSGRVACVCGRTFPFQTALEQHRRDKGHPASTSAGPDTCAGTNEVPKAVSSNVASVRLPVRMSLSFCVLVIMP